MKVEIQSKKWVKPATATPSHLQKHQLSAIDELQPSFLVPILFHFDTITETDTTLARLEESLSKVLTLYYPFAGKYDADESLVCCEDQGVEFVVATVDCKLDGVADGEEDKKALLSGLERIHSFAGVAWTTVFSVQVNVFTCGGFVISFSFNHKVCDMYTVTTFIDAWATACRHGDLNDTPLCRPTFNTSSFLPPTNHLPPPSKPPPPPATNLQTPPKFQSKRYIFTAEVLSKLKATIKGRASIEFTRVELVMAIIARSLASINVRPLVISQPMNLRPKMTLLSIENNCCGNFCSRVTTSIKLGQKFPDLVEFAGVLQSSVRTAASEIEKVSDWTELSERVEESYMEFAEEAMKGEKVNLIRFSSWCRFPLYEIDFGWGKPCLICTIPVPGVIFVVLMDCRGDGGVEAWVCLKEEDIHQFQKQADILEYAAF